MSWLRISMSMYDLAVALKPLYLIILSFAQTCKDIVHPTAEHCCMFFIMSTEFDKNISDRRYDRTDCKNGFDFFMRLTKWPKIAVKKCQNLIFKVNFQRQKSSESFRKKNSLKNINLGAHFLFSSILCSTKIE